MVLTEAIRTLRHADAQLVERSELPLPAHGLEAVISGAVLGLQRGEWWVPGPRERVGAVLRDVPVDRLVDPSRGARPWKVAPADPAPANRALHAVGLAHATQRPALVHLGIGSTADGAFHEALNLTALLGAPVIFLVAVHPLTGDAPLGRQLATSPTSLAQAFGISALQVDGSDAYQVLEAVHTAREAHSPYLIEATLSPGATS